MSSAVATAKISAGLSAHTMLTSTNTTTGTLDSTIPRTPPSCWETCSENVGRASSSGSAVRTGGLAAAVTGVPLRVLLDMRIQFVVRVVDHLPAVAHRDPTAGREGP